MHTSDIKNNAHFDATWIEETLEALDMAAILFDDDARCLMANRRFRSLFLPDDPRHLNGLGLSEVMERVAIAGRLRRPLGITHAKMAATGETAIRSFAREREVPLADGGLTLETSNPTPRGGYLVTYRNVSRDRLGELRALDLVSDAFESVDMGVVLWDAGLTVRRGNAAWIKFFGPLDPDGSIRTFAMEYLAGSIVTEEDGRTSEMIIDDIIASAHQKPTQIDCFARDGRRIQIATFPTHSGGVVATAIDVTERRLTEAQARAMLEEVVESLGEGVALYDSELKLRLSNDALHRHAHRNHPRMPYGTHLVEHCNYVVGLGQLALPPGTTAEMFAKQITTAISSYAKDVEVPTSDGRLLELSCYPSTMDGYLVTIKDVTERRAADARAREMLEDAVEALGEGVALYDKNKHFMMNNRAFRKLVFNDLPLSEPGVPLRDEVSAVLAAGLVQVPQGETEDSVLNWIEKSVESASQDLELVMANGRILEVSNFHTKLGGYLISMRDVTERNRAAQATREADALVRTIVEASPTALLVSRISDGSILYHSLLHKDAANGFHALHEFFAEPRDGITFLNALKQSGTLVDYPVQFRDPSDGSAKQGLISARIASFRGEDIIVSSTRDITDQLTMQAELEHQREMAHQNEKLSAMGELLASVAHELNNPLSVVVGYALMLEESADDPVLSRRIGEISAAAARCARIVKTFLAMARQRPSMIEPTDLNEILEVAVEVAGHGIRSAGASLELKRDPHLRQVAVDADQIVQVFSNLLINAEHAIKDRGENGRLVITTRNDPAGHQVIVSFEDNGPGISSELQNRIFEPFFTTKDVGDGTGIGLAYCHRIVTGCGGQITVSSLPGEGATFDVMLPLSDVLQKRPLIDKTTTRDSGGAVLVVDDDETVGGLIGEILRSDGYEVQIVNRAQTALDLCQSQSYAAIISDQRMPGMNGTEFYAELCRVAPAMAHRLAFLTGDTLSSGVAEEIALSGRPFLEKPVAPSDLLGLVARLIEGTS